MHTIPHTIWSSDMELYSLSRYFARFGIVFSQQSRRRRFEDLSAISSLLPGNSPFPSWPRLERSSREGDANDNIYKITLEGRLARLYSDNVSPVPNRVSWLCCVIASISYSCVRIYASDTSCLSSRPAAVAKEGVSPSPLR